MTAVPVDRQGPAGQSSAGVSGPARMIAMICLMAGTLMQALDATIANVALPYLQGSLSASRDQITWVLTSYVIAAAIMTTPIGWIASRFGRKNIYILSLIGFTVASALCGAAQSLEQIVICRIVQGAIGAALAPLAQSMMFDLYPAEKRGQAMAMFGAGVMLGPICGPTLGGFLTDQFSWRWVFYINVPIGIAAAVGLLLFPSKGVRDTTLRFDWMGFGFLTLGLGALQLMLDRGTDQGWFDSSEIVIEAVIACTGIYLFFVHLATADNPLIPRVLTTDRNFVTGFLALLVLGQVLNASMAALPPYLQTLGGYSVLDTGLLMSPRGVGTITAMLVSGALSGRIDPRIQLCIGVMISSYTMWVMSRWTPAVDVGTITTFAVLQGLGLGMLFVPINMITFATVAQPLRTTASAVSNVARSLGGAMGVSLSSALIANSTQTAHAGLAAHIGPFNRALQMNGPGFMWNPNLPSGAQAINGLVEREALNIAYTNNFLFLGGLGLLMIVVATFVRKVKVQPPQPGEPIHLE